ncbi:MAG: hypothetical protein JWM19_1443 [Actinomycetia bacterium]|nr:hypothetical protein [Actinomycetes bacterium]
MVDGRAATGPTQLATAPGSAPDLAGAGLAGAGLVGVAVRGVATGVADVDGGVGADAWGVAGDVDDNARGFAAAEAVGVLEVLLLFGVHAVAARASPSAAPTAKFPMKRRILLRRLDSQDGYPTRPNRRPSFAPGEATRAPAELRILNDHFSVRYGVICPCGKYAKFPAAGAWRLRPTPLQRAGGGPRSPKSHALAICRRKSVSIRSPD